VALSAELALLSAVLFAWWGIGAQRSQAADVFLIGLGVAMGLQSVAIVRLRIPGVASTYLTGTLTSLMAGVVRRASGRQASTPEAPTHSSGLLALVWLIYVAGAALTTVVSPHGGPLALLLPIALIAIVLAGADRTVTRVAEPSRRVE
jgi:uncharacterized membrane protein YoaK (UPF0700 family)